MNNEIDSTWISGMWKPVFHDTDIVWYQWNGNLFNSIEKSFNEQRWNATYWENYGRFSKVFDVNGNVSYDSGFAWNGSNYIEGGSQRDIFTYDINNNITEDIKQIWVPWLHGLRNDYKLIYSEYGFYIGVQEINSNSFSIYPNPTSQTFKISFSSPLSTATTVLLTNTLGQHIASWQLAAGLPIANCQLPTGMAGGIYFVEVQNEEGKVVRKLVVR